MDRSLQGILGHDSFITRELIHIESPCIHGLRIWARNHYGPERCLKSNYDSATFQWLLLQLWWPWVSLEKYKGGQKLNVNFQKILSFWIIHGSKKYMKQNSGIKTIQQVVYRYCCMLYKWVEYFFLKIPVHWTDLISFDGIAWHL